MINSLRQISLSTQIKILRHYLINRNKSKSFSKKNKGSLIDAITTMYEYLGRKLYSMYRYRGVVDLKGAKLSAAESLGRVAEDIAYIKHKIIEKEEEIKDAVYIELEYDMSEKEYNRIMYKINSLEQYIGYVVKDVRETRICLETINLDSDEKTEAQKVEKCLNWAYRLVDSVASLMKLMDDIVELANRYSINRVSTIIDSEIMPVATNCFMESSLAAAHIQRIGAKYGIKVEHKIQKDSI